MANLNFQQPPRIPSASLTRSTNSGFTTSSSISGNVTPTSSLMFQSQQQNQPPSNSNFVSGQQQNQQLSPNRIGAGNLTGVVGNSGAPMSRKVYQYNNPSSIQQRGASGFGSATSSLNMGSFMQSQTARYGSQSGGINNFQSVFGSASDSTPPTLLDMSEFPSLTNARGQNDQHSNVLQAPGSKPYGNYHPPLYFFFVHVFARPLTQSFYDAYKRQNE
jgi:CCR4-NOT transcription complex subunit 2